jgi:predicted nuclease with TOPRIM domain
VWKFRVEEARLRVQGGDASVVEELQSLRGEVDSLRGELSELNERVDFAERLLTRGRDEGARNE